MFMSAEQTLFLTRKLCVSPVKSMLNPLFEASCLRKVFQIFNRLGKHKKNTVASEVTLTNWTFGYKRDALYDIMK